jgi:hypothetical protein
MNRLGTENDPGTRTVEEARIIDFLLLGGWAYALREGQRPWAEAETRRALRRWVAAGLPVATDTRGETRYDPVEVLNFMKAAGLEGSDPFWEQRYLSTGRRFVLDQHGEWAARGAPGAVHRLPPRHFTVRFRRTFGLGRFPPGTPLRLRLPLPLEGPDLTDLRIDMEDTNPSAALGLTPGRLEAKLGAPEAGHITLGYRASFTAHPYVPAGGSTLDAAEAELYTRPAEGLIRVTPRVDALAAELAGGREYPAGAVRAFWDYLMDRMRCGAVHYHDIDMARPMDWLLDRGWYDCETGAALLASLCRARGIPARIVSGYVLYPLAPTYHFWAEIWLEGWVPFDLLSWDLSGGGRDHAWRDVFAGALDYRMPVQRLPRHFTGPMSVRLPARWHILTRALPEGIRIGIHDMASGEAAFSDDVSVGIA